MKVTALIIAIYIFLLTIQPLLSVFIDIKNCEAVECCSNKSYKNEQPQKKNNKSEQHKQCNPFQVCGSCVIYSLTTQPLFASIKSEISTKQNFTYQFVFSSQFASDIWQPPKIV